MSSRSKRQNPTPLSPELQGRLEELHQDCRLALTQLENLNDMRPATKHPENEDSIAGLNRDPVSVQGKLYPPGTLYIHAKKSYRFLPDGNLDQGSWTTLMLGEPIEAMRHFYRIVDVSRLQPLLDPNYVSETQEILGDTSSWISDWSVLDEVS